MTDEQDTEIGLLAEEFITRARSGENPTISEYVRRRPDLEAGIREVFPLLYVMEDVKPEHRSEGTTEKELGDYRLLRVIGRGGMGVVYEAEQKTLGRRVALKVLPTSATYDERFKERFRLEARAAARLQHPHIVPVIDSGEHEGTYYFTMQYIDGRGLDVVVHDVRRALSGDDHADSMGRRLLASQMTVATTSAGEAPERSDASEAPRPREVASVGRIYYENVARIGLQAAGALAYAHARGVLHRDIKPSNLLLDRRGHLWIADFGLAKEIGSDGVTGTGDVLGTFRYMPPERFKGESDVQSDVYGLGITLHELLTRRVAYADEDKAALAARIMREAPKRPRAVDPKIPSELDAIVGKAVAHDRTERYATAEALASDLQAYLEGRPITARAPTLGYFLRMSIRRHRALAATIAAALMVIVASTVWYVLRLKTEQENVRFNQYTTNVSAAASALRDDDLVTARRILDGAPSEYRGWEWRHVDSQLEQSLRSVAHPDIHAIAVTHSPDGKWLAVANQRGATAILDATTLALKRELDVSEGTCVDWSSQGNLIAIGSPKALEIWRWPEAVRVRRLSFARVRGVCFSRDGTRLVAGNEEGVARIWQVETGETLIDLEPSSPVLSVDFQASGNLVLTGGQDGRVVVWDAHTGEQRWARPSSNRGLHSVAFVGDQLVAAPSMGFVRVFSVDDGREVKQLVYHNHQPNLSASADGRHIVAYGWHIRLWDAQSFELKALYRTRASVRAAVFHPSMPRFTSVSPAGEVAQWYCGLDCDPATWSGHIDDVFTLALDPKGRTVASGGIGGVIRLWDTRSGAQTRTWIGHHNAVTGLAFDPSGQRLASGDFQGEVRIWDISSGEILHRIKSGSRVGRLCFSRDGSSLFVVGDPGTLQVWDPLTGESKARIRVSDSSCESIGVANHKPWLSVGTASGEVVVFHTETLRRLRTYAGHQRSVTGCVFDPTDRWLASTSWDGTVRIWRADQDDDEPRVLHRPTPGDARDLSFLSVAFSPDGSRVAAGTHKGAIHLWDTGRDRLTAILRAGGWITGLRFHPDGTQLYSACSDTKVRVFHTRPLRELVQHAAEAVPLEQAAHELVDGLRPATAHLDELLDAVGRQDVDDVLREAARRIVHRERGTPRALKDLVWRAVSDPNTDAAAFLIAFGVAHGLDRAAWHRAQQDSERTTLLGVSWYRSGNGGDAAKTLSDATRLNGRFPELLAIDLAVLAMSRRLHARQTLEHWARSVESSNHVAWCGPIASWSNSVQIALVSERKAQEAFARLERHLGEHPEAHTPRAQQFVAEARQALQIKDR